MFLWDGTSFMEELIKVISEKWLFADFGKTTIGSPVLEVQLISCYDYWLQSNHTFPFSFLECGWFAACFLRVHHMWLALFVSCWTPCTMWNLKTSSGMFSQVITNGMKHIQMSNLPPEAWGVAPGCQVSALHHDDGGDQDNDVVLDYVDAGKTEKLVSK